MKHSTRSCITLTILLWLSAYTHTFGQAAIKDTCIKVPGTLSVNAEPKLYITHACELGEFHFKLYDRWGKTVYQAIRLESPLNLDITEKIKMRQVEKSRFPNGVYVWVATYTKTVDGKPVQAQSTGMITILSEP